MLKRVSKSHSEAEKNRYWNPFQTKLATKSTFKWWCPFTCVNGTHYSLLDTVYQQKFIPWCLFLHATVQFWTTLFLVCWGYLGLGGSINKIHHLKSAHYHLDLYLIFHTWLVLWFSSDKISLTSKIPFKRLTFEK